jgi:hypothetical protein
MRIIEIDHRSISTARDGRSLAGHRDYLIDDGMVFVSRIRSYLAHGER